jgi:hypothetical protein
MHSSVLPCFPRCCGAAVPVDGVAPGVQIANYTLTAHDLDYPAKLEKVPATQSEVGATPRDSLPYTRPAHLTFYTENLTAGICMFPSIVAEQLCACQLFVDTSDASYRF